METPMTDFTETEKRDFEAAAFRDAAIRNS